MIRFVDKKILLISTILLLTGVFLLMAEKAAVDTWFSGLVQMAYIFTLLAVIKVLSFPIILGKYDQDIKTFLSAYGSSEKQFYYLSLGYTYLLAIFVLFAAISIVYSTMVNVAYKISSFPKQLVSMAIIRGWVSAVVFTPSGAPMASALQSTGVDWLDVLPYITGLSLISLMIAYILGPSISLFKNKKQQEEFNYKAEVDWQQQEEQHWQGQDVAKAKRNIAELILIFILFIVVVLIVGYLTSLSVLHGVIAVSPFYAGLWSLYLKKNRKFGKNVVDYLSKDMIGLADQFVLFTCSGLLGIALKTMAMGGEWFTELPFHQDTFLFWFMPLVPVVIVFMSLVGINPLVSIVIIGEALQPMLLFDDLVILVLYLIIGGVVGLTLSPFGATVIYLSHIIDASPFMVGLRWSKSFSLVYGLVSICLVSIFYIYFY